MSPAQLLSKVHCQLNYKRRARERMKELVAFGKCRCIYPQRVKCYWWAIKDQDASMSLEELLLNGLR